MKKKARRKYSDEFKAEAVKLVADQGYKTAEAARNLGIHNGVLRRWISQRSSEVAHISLSTSKLSSRTQAAEA